MQTKRVAVITGAGGGIGLAICRRLAKDGFFVVVTDVTLERAVAVADELVSAGHDAFGVALDVCQDEAAVASVFAEIYQRKGRIDVLVNNAGGSAQLIDKRTDFVQSEESAWQFVVNLNLLGTMRCVRAVLGYMMEAGYGRIINTASIAGRCGLPGWADYSAAKAGVIGFTKTLAMEVGQCGITVNSISPGLIERMRPDADGKLPQSCQSNPTHGNWLWHTGTPQDVAALIAFIASEEAGYITGEDFLIDGGRALGPTSQAGRQDLFKTQDGGTNA